MGKMEVSATMQINMEKKLEQTKRYFNNKMILITGSSGYIANGIINFLSKIDCTLFRVTRDISRLDKLPGTASIVDYEVDITDIFNDWDSNYGIALIKPADYEGIDFEMAL